MSELSLDPPFFTAGTGKAVLSLAEESEHEGVGSVAQLGVGEGLLDGVVTVENNGKFGAHSKTEDITVSFGNLGEGLAQVKDVQEGKITENWNSNWTWRKSAVVFE